MPQVRSSSRTATAFLFSALLALFCIGTLAVKKNQIALQEKRQLAQFPPCALVLSNFAEWTKAVDNYVNDHFIFREKLIQFNSLLQLKLFHVNQSKNWIVLPGKAGWFFYLGDWALHDYLRRPSPDDEQLVRSWVRLLAFRQHRLRQKGGQYLLAIAPNKECVYSEYYPERFTKRRGTTYLEMMQAQMRSSPERTHFLDLTETLLQEKQKRQVYFKTDTHWNDLGAYAAYRAIMARVQNWYPAAAALPADRLARTYVVNSFGGDLVLAMELSGRITESHAGLTVRQPCASAEDAIVRSEKLPAGQTLERNGCPDGAPLRVLVISDSFVGRMRSFLNETFQQVVYSREVPLQFLGSFINVYQPDLVLDLRVARNLPKVMSAGPDEKN